MAGDYDGSEMEAGEKELRQVFEETTTKNVKAAIAHGNETRRLIREVQEELKAAQARIAALEAQNNQFRIQLAGVQTRLFSGGTS